MCIYYLGNELIPFYPKTTELLGRMGMGMKPSANSPGAANTAQTEPRAS